MPRGEWLAYATIEGTVAPLGRGRRWTRDAIISLMAHAREGVSASSFTLWERKVLRSCNLGKASWRGGPSAHAEVKGQLVIPLALELPGLDGLAAAADKILP